MNLPWLASTDAFPPVSTAWDEFSPAPGLLAAGGSLSVDHLRAAYRAGIFPWYSDGQPILWWSPDPRMVLQVAQFRVHRSLRQTLQRFRANPNCEIRIDHDFAFPTIERFPMANPFVMVNRRADGSVRVDAPGFGPASNGGGMNGLAQLAAMGAMSDKAGEGGDAPKLPVLEGTFTLTTDGQILANNTDEGPVTDTTGSRLEWKVTPRTAAAPTALIKLVP